jgi:hypothetical protein
MFLIRYVGYINLIYIILEIMFFVTPGRLFSCVPFNGFLAFAGNYFPHCSHRNKEQPPSDRAAVL